MRRALSLGLVGGCVAIIAILATGAGGGGGYRVRAIFDNAFSVIPGEDVKIAGVKVGSIQALDICTTPEQGCSLSNQKAAIVLNITRPGFNDFRLNTPGRQDGASCIIRPQSLIGEKFVECTPMQPRVAGAPAPPQLNRVPAGQPGAGQYLLPVSQTQHTVDIDLINNILRLPLRQRLSIILNELGTGLAGRGQDLRSIILRADPALQQTDRVLGILAGQNRVLTALAANSDTILAPLARDRAQVADFVSQANTTAQATAERGAALQRDVALLPAFLRQLQPTMTRLGGFADQATPVLVDLRSQAPAISRFIRELGPFSAAATPALKALGDAADVGRPALIQAKPIIGDINTLAQNAQPLAANLASLTTSLHDTGGVERVLDYVFYQVSAINGFDSFGHYLRAALLINLCSTYTVMNTDPTCSANFKKPATTGSGTKGTAARSGGRPISPFLRRENAILRRLLGRGRHGRRHRLGRTLRERGGAGGPLSLPPALLPAPGAGPLGGILPGAPNTAASPGHGSSGAGSSGQGPSGPSGPASAAPAPSSPSPGSASPGSASPGSAHPSATETPNRHARGAPAGSVPSSGPPSALLDYLLGSG
ncbi:MAG TPA: MlaD family protein [Solirubrobacteraceae bacterium]|nr:MlaD family protein [Solirubrobacteraceae bacterium]